MLNRLYNRYGKRVVRVVLGVVATIIIIAVYFALNSSTADAPAETKKLPEVTVQSVKELEETGTFSVVGTVRAVSEAKLQAEAGGRITAVNVKIGDAVLAGTILGSIENNSERAQLLQAEGAYESALASSLQGQVSLDEAKVGVRNTYRDTYSTIDAIIRNLTDDFFQNPRSSMRGFRLTGTGKTEAFNEARGDIEVILTTLAQQIANNHAGKTEQDILTEIEDSVNTVNNFTSGLALIISDYDANTSFTESDLATYKTRLAGARASLDGALTTISRTRQTYEQAVLSGSTKTSSQSSAGLKIALGALRSAQVNYEKTLIRTPISGVVNTLNLTTGEFISQGQPAAIVANNGSLEVSTALSEKDLFRIHIGDTVMVNTTVAGTISQIAPAIDPITGKGEVKISITNGTDLKNGSTVSVAFTHKNDSTTASSDIIVPLKSLKMLASGSIAFGVSENNTLVSLPVVLGAIQGDSVQITEGLTLETEIVTDARGLKEGDEVIVIRK